MEKKVTKHHVTHDFQNTTITLPKEGFKMVHKIEISLMTGLFITIWVAFVVTSVIDLVKIYLK